MRACTWAFAARHVKMLNISLYACVQLFMSYGEMYWLHPIMEDPTLDSLNRLALYMYTSSQHPDRWVRLVRPFILASHALTSHSLSLLMTICVSMYGVQVPERLHLS